LEKSVSSHSAHNTITLALAGALAARAFSAATAHADPDAPTPIAGTDSPITQSDAPWFEQLQYSQDFSVLNFLTTPFGDIDFPSWFVEAVGPTFFEPSAPWLAGLL
jgi:hypothetical protein